MTRGAAVTRRLAPALLAALALAVGCNRTPDDRKLVQGEWAVTGVEFPGTLGLGTRVDEESKNLVVVVKGDRVTVAHTGEKGRVAALFTLDPTKNPKELDAPEVFVSHDKENEQPLPGPARGIYKFEGDELVIALALGQGKDLPRPTEFKASVNGETGQMVVVVHLKRK